MLTHKSRARTRVSCESGRKEEKGERERDGVILKASEREKGRERRERDGVILKASE